MRLVAPAVVVAERFDGTADLSCDAGPPRFVMCRLTAGDAAVWDAGRPAGRASASGHASYVRAKMPVNPL